MAATGEAKGPRSWALLPLRSLQQGVLRAFAFGEQRQRFALDMGLEMRALLMRLESGFVAEQFVEQELCGIFFRPGNQEQFCAGFALRLRQEARQNIGDPVGLSFPGFPLRDDQQAAAVDSLADGSLVDCISVHGACSLLVCPQSSRAIRTVTHRYNSISDEVYV